MGWGGVVSPVVIPEGPAWICVPRRDSSVVVVYPEDEDWEPSEPTGEGVGEWEAGEFLAPAVL